MARLISKSKYLHGLQCDKLLWIAYNAKHLIPAVDPATQAIFDQGHDVGNLAKKIYPDGIEIGGDPADLEETIRLTKPALSRRKPLFEASFSFQGGYCRVDVLKPAGKSAWDVIEVKCTTDVKEVHLDDLAFQAWVLAGAGLQIRRCFLCHINSDYVRAGEIDPRKFFILEEVTTKVAALSGRAAARLGRMIKLIGQPGCPEVRIGKQCSDPYDCPLRDHCWGHLPEASVFTLYRGGAKGFALLDRGIQRLVDVPDDFKLTGNQEIQRETLRSGKPYVDAAALQGFLGQLEYPVSYLDFETFATAIPLFDGSSPYQQIPFQYSLHIVRAPGARPEHYSFLAEETADPRHEFMRQLVNDLPGTGSVVTYNASFEVSRLQECSELLPEFKPWLKKLKPRIVDLLLPFRGFRYYHPDQNGSASMKAVLPALAGGGYEQLAIQEGGTASREFMRVTYGNVPAEERARVRRDLEAYCGLDTLGMVQIVNQLARLSKSR